MNIYLRGCTLEEPLLCTLPGQRLGTTKGGERVEPGQSAHNLRALFPLQIYCKGPARIIKVQPVSGRDYVFINGIFHYRLLQFVTTGYHTIIWIYKVS